MKLLSNLVLCALALFAFSSSAADAVSKPFQQALSATPMAELPAKAADLVKSARISDRVLMTAEVVEAALAVNPNTGPAIVAAIAKAVPDMAAIAAGKAAELQPGRAAEIARAAAAAAPSKASKIVAEVCRAAPPAYRTVAIALAQLAPAESIEILREVASVFPELKTGIDRALAASGTSAPSVASVLDSAKTAAANSPLPFASTGSGFPLRGPAVAPPYLPGSGTSSNVTLSTSGTVPPGGRNYASP
jgi:hypothetical protein